MRSDTFRVWLAEHDCQFGVHTPHGRSKGHPEVTVRREGKMSYLPHAGAHDDLSSDAIAQVCSDLGLDPSQLPGPKSRV